MKKLYALWVPSGSGRGGGGGGGGGLDLESRAKFPYIHESRNFFFRFHESNEVDFWICSQTFTSSDFVK